MAPRRGWLTRGRFESWGAQRRVGAVSCRFAWNRGSVGRGCFGGAPAPVEGADQQPAPISGDDQPREHQGDDERAGKIEHRAGKQIAVAADPTKAGRLLAAASTLRHAIGAPLPSSDLASYERTVAAVRAVLGDVAFQAVWEEGRALTLDQAVQHALVVRAG